MQQILVVEDEADIRELLRFNLEREGFSVLEAADGPQALDMARRHTPALVLLDVMLPGLDGFEVCRRLGAQTETAHIPILMLTARGEEMDRVVGLSLGADDYVVKPFSVRELMLRVRAVLRRGGRETQSPALERHGIRLRTDAHTAEVEDTPLNLTATEFRLLEDLLRHAGTVRTREQLLNKVWGYSFEGYARTVDTH
ncbi:response regulator transcription factor, partial [uncultured Desulfovibrio sp.]